jgi:hypothetical protein
VNTSLQLPADLLQKTAAEIVKYHQQQPDSVPGPEIAHLVEMIEVALWAGIQTEEGRRLRFGLAYVPPEQCSALEPVKFTDTVPLSVDNVVRLAPAVLSKGSRLGVQPVNGRLHIWGVAQVLPACVRVRALAPGTVAVNYGVNHVGVLQAPDYHVVGGRPSQVIELVARHLSDHYAEIPATATAALLLMIIDAVRRQGNGGTLLIVPAKQSRWLKSIEPARTPLSRYPGVSAIRDQLIGEAKQQSQGTGIERVLRCKDVDRFLTGDRVSDAAWRTIETVGQLSAVDGALIVTKTLDLLTFGAKIKDVPTATHSAGAEKTQYLQHTVPVSGKPVPKPLTGIGGTRHRSAHQFVNVNRSSLALVASHDGPLSLMAFEVSQKAVVVTRHLERLID